MTFFSFFLFFSLAIIFRNPHICEDIDVYSESTHIFITIFNFLIFNFWKLRSNLLFLPDYNLL